MAPDPDPYNFFKDLKKFYRKKLCLMKNAKIDHFSGKHDLSSCRSCIRCRKSDLKEIFTAPQLHVLSYSMYPKTSQVNFVNKGHSSEPNLVRLLKLTVSVTKILD